ncbi:efflux RND transporter periplasmic adaptor subunit [Candidatus Sororendozoicomonas aggregata]|uniref:efflux RND transporter periplasmic adaptor subunit n=1 Tax=Candidatus Sororendozoicomonas aggregata TaxID=3073239 RepID=UPI002ED248EA
MNSIVKRFKHRNWLVTSFFITSTLILAGCSEEKKHAKMPPPGVSVIKVTNQEVSNTHEFVARTKAARQVDLRTRVEGFLDKRDFIEGELVDEGKLLFEIDQKPYLVSLNKAEADLASKEATLVKAQKDLDRSQDLFKKGHISQADLDTKVSEKDRAAAAVDAAKATVETAKLNLSYTKITAPFTGKIGKARYSVGNLVSPTSEPLATLTSVDPIYVNFQVNDQELLNYRMQEKQGDPADALKLTLELPNGATYNEPGTFNFADTSVDETTGTLNVRASFPNPEGILYPGLYVTLIAESKDKELKPVIPQFAVQENQSGRFVLVVNDKNEVEIRQVTMGQRIGPMWAVNSGLKSGEKIIVDGLQKVKTNAPVTPTVVTINPETGTIVEPPASNKGA